MGKPHLWVVYPRSRKENMLHLQIVGVWEPSTLESKFEEEITSNSDSYENKLSEVKLPEGDDYFSVLGELIFTKP